MGILLELAGVRAGYGGGDILQGVDLSVDEGSLTCIVGPNGAGKSTVLRVISGLLRPTAGTVRFRGDSLAGRSPRSILARGIVQVPQERSLFPTMSVWENVRLGAFSVRDRRLVERRLATVVEMFPIVAERRREPAASLSGGQQKIVEFARALMLDPALLEKIGEHIRRLNERGITFLVVEHNMGWVMNLCTEVVVLHRGRAIASGKPDAVRQEPAVLDAYLGA